MTASYQSRSVTRARMQLLPASLKIIAAAASKENDVSKIAARVALSERVTRRELSQACEQVGLGAAYVAEGSHPAWSELGAVYRELATERIAQNQERKKEESASVTTSFAQRSARANFETHRAAEKEKLSTQMFEVGDPAEDEKIGSIDDEAAMTQPQAAPAPQRRVTAAGLKYDERMERRENLKKEVARNYPERIKDIAQLIAAMEESNELSVLRLLSLDYHNRTIWSRLNWPAAKLEVILGRLYKRFEFPNIPGNRFERIVKLRAILVQAARQSERFT